MSKDRMREIAGQVARMTEEQRAELAARLPIVTIQQHAISMRNTCMVALQTDLPVTIIGGFRQWLAAGRVVRKGEKAIYILKPITRGRADDEPTPANDDQGDNTAGGFRFVPVPMFDVSQTDELPGGATVH